MIHSYNISIKQKIHHFAAPFKILLLYMNISNNCKSTKSKNKY